MAVALLGAAWKFGSWCKGINMLLRNHDERLRVLEGKRRQG